MDSQLVLELALTGLTAASGAAATGLVLAGRRSDPDRRALIQALLRIGVICASALASMLAIMGR